VFWNVAARATLLVWIALMAAIALARVLLTRAHRRTPEAARNPERWRRLYICGTFAGGVGWGIAGLVLFPSAPLAYQVFLAYVLGGMAVGAAAVMSPVLAAYWAFLPPITLPIIVQLFLRGDAMSIAMGIMFTACTGMFMGSARQMHASITESIRLRFENLDLVQHLSAAKEHAEQVNQSLQSEVGERTRAQRQLSASLEEKEVLLTEIHHRVKNNLQVISSLLSLQSRSLTPEARNVFTDSQNRVRSMALVHEKLYQSRDLAKIDFAAYLRELGSYLCRVYHSTAEAIPLRIHAQEVYLTIERAVPCGLIVSELLSNALKYAFPAGRRGEIAIDMSASPAAGYRLTVRDTGIGLAAGFDVRHPHSPGLRIVNTLTEQLGGTLACANEGGAAFSVVFPIEEDHEPLQRHADSHLGG